MPTFVHYGYEETPKTKKVAVAIQQNWPPCFRAAIRNQGASNLVLSITKVNVTIDLSLAKVYLSIFPRQTIPTKRHSRKQAPNQA